MYLLSWTRTRIGAIFGFQHSVIMIAPSRVTASPAVTGLISLNLLELVLVPVWFRSYPAYLSVLQMRFPLEGRIRSTAPDRKISKFFKVEGSKSIMASLKRVQSAFLPMSVVRGDTDLKAILRWLCSDIQMLDPRPPTRTRKKKQTFSSDLHSRVRPDNRQMQRRDFKE